MKRNFIRKATNSIRNGESLPYCQRCDTDLAEYIMQLVIDGNV